MDFFAFDKVYLERLRNGDPATEHHFFVYFEKLLHIKLRARAIESDKVEDLKQDTFIRVIAAVRKEGGVRQPERFGAFVNSVCNNVLLEYYRSLGKNRQMDGTHEEIPDKVLDLEGMMASKQCAERVWKILSGLPARDRELLRAVLLEENDKDTVCRDIGVDRNYLRVLVHRAKDKFKALYESRDWRVRREFSREKFGYAMFEMTKPAGQFRRRERSPGRTELATERVISNGN
ncbi:MAG TPA: sigma-70 family RNA polymerase sigma factor [Candidatus Acidoferrum sp.]|jgi:RNA polymerase sigma-70 factor (ECF subfamily)|nr:sigma-70 family RNA polymerase sigma factor [Candidatus Acidoferrum sp.]